MTARACWTLVVLAIAPSTWAADLEVTAIQVFHRHGQTFVTWKDVAEGEEGAKYRYSLYRCDRPITAENLARAELCYHGVLNNAAKQFGYAFNLKDRLDPNKPYAIIEEGAKPLPPWSGLAVHTVEQPGPAYYAVVATDEKLQPVSSVVPDKSATTQAVEEKPGPIQPIKLYDSKERKSYVAQTSITGQQGLPLAVSLHGSQGTGGPAGEWGDYYLYFGTPDMGYRDGLPGVFAVQENRAKEGNCLLLRPRDAIEHPNGRGAFETMWLGYSCVPTGAAHEEPRYYRFTENRLLWMIDWTVRHYGADPLRISVGGSSMGGLGSINVGFRHPELFAAAYPATAPFLWWRPSSLASSPGSDPKATVMADGRTTYADYTNSPKFAAEQHADMPFLGWVCGRRDPNHNWQEYIDMVQALTANHHGFAFAWNDGGHSEGGRPMALITKYYPATKFARNVSYPAFGNSSIDSKLGGGSKDDGDREGGVNLGFNWKDVIDEQDKWSVALSNDLCQDTMTVDVTPRRCQTFKMKPGAECQWTSSTGASGKVTVDRWGLATAPGVIIKAGDATVLTIQRAQDQPVAMPRVKVSEDGRGFRFEPSGRSFIAWGFNYDHDEDGRLLEDYWEAEWKKVEEDFAEMKQLGANVVRIHLQFGKFMDGPTQPNQKSLDRLGDLLRLAERQRIYLDLTGLGCYHKQDVPAWYDQLNETQRWNAQAEFWRAVADRCKHSPAVFCYDLMNEPVVPGGRRNDGDWLGPAFAGKHFVQVVTLDQANRPRPEIARRWVHHLTQAIRKVDERHLITVGLVDWSLDRPGLTSGFVPKEIAGDLDFLCVHLYPEAGKVKEALDTLAGFAIGKPVVIEETFPLKCSPEELEKFIDGSTKHASGLIGFYWGRTPEQLRGASGLAETVTRQWLELFERKAKLLTN